MGLFDFLTGRKTKIVDWAGVDEFIDRQAAFLVNRGMYEYSRARSGVLADQLFREKQFQAAVEAGRWRAYPICVGNVGELVEALMRAAAPEARDRIVEAVVASGRRVLTRYPLPDGFEPGFWTASAAEVEARLRTASLAPPKPVQDIAMASFAAFFENAPLHPDVMKHDYEVVQNNVRGMMLNIADRFRAEAEPGRLVAALPAA